MLQTFTRRSNWLFFTAFILFLSLPALTMAQNKVSFTVTSDGVPVRGISVNVEGISMKTNSSGIATIYLLDGDYSFMVYTTNVSENIVVGNNTFNYYESGGG